MENENKIDVRSLLQFAVRNVRGEIDDDASATFFLKNLRQYKEEYKKSIKEVAKAVNEVFDQNPGQVLTMTTLQGLSLRLLDTNTENYDNISELVEEYVKNDPNFESKRGRGGGVRRLSDSSGAPSEAPAEEQPPQPLVPVIRRSSSPPAGRASSAPASGSRSSQRPPAR